MARMLEGARNPVPTSIPLRGCLEVPSTLGHERAVCGRPKRCSRLDAVFTTLVAARGLTGSQHGDAEGVVFLGIAYRRTRDRERYWTAVASPRCADRPR